MSWKYIFAKKDLEMLLAEMAGEHRLHRVLGPVALTSLGVGCIIGAGIFVLTGVAAADIAGPSIMISFAIAALGCALAALCYAEFAAMAPVAGSAYTYAYTTLGEIFAWIIGWDLILEYAMGCATVASSWSGYLNEFLGVLGFWQVPAFLCSDPFTPIEGVVEQPWFNLPSLIIMLFVTTVLVLGIRESARTNAILVIIKVSVVFFVIIVGWAYMSSSNWTDVPVTHRVLPQERVMPTLAKNYLNNLHKDEKDYVQSKEFEQKAAELTKQLIATYRLEWVQQETDRLQKAGRISTDSAQEMIKFIEEETKALLPQTSADKQALKQLLPQVRLEGEKRAATSWGLLGMMGLNRWLIPLDDA
ncbi:MAG TPA: amino acid permease, partial [Thermoguttaceae bacterium]